MSRVAKLHKHTRMWMVGVGVLVMLAVSTGVAAARTGGSGNGPARGAQSGATTTTAAAAKPAKSTTPGKKPGPSPSPTGSPTTSPAPTPTPSPSAGTDVQISLPGFVPNYRFGDILVDEAHGHIYITGGKGTSDLVVTDLDGGNVRTLAGIAPGAAGMALSPDGTKLYIAASDQDWLRIVDTTTFALSGQFAGKTDGTMSCPRDVAFAAGQLWVSWGCDNAPAGIGRVDLQTGAFQLNAIGSIDDRLATAPLLATTPSQPSMVIAGETGSNPALVVRFEATSTLLYQQAIRRTDGGSVDQLAITPDGSQVIVPSGAPYYHPALRTSDLVEVHQYPTDAYPNAVAIRDDGLVVAGINGAYEKDVYVFQPGGSTPIATYEFGHLPNQETWPYTLVPGGLAVHGDRIYAVTQVPGQSGVVTLRIRVVE
jgi:DNA-binding beta-propeller fold protein YncE